MSVSSESQPIRIECAVSPGFEAWIAQASGSLVVSTYQAGKVAMLGWDGRQVSLLMRQFDKPLGLAVEHPKPEAAGGEVKLVRMALATRNEVTLLTNAPLLAPDYIETQPGRYDALFLPRTTWHTGDLHTHDLAFLDGELLLVATRFSCLARLSSRYNFTPVWRPKFVTDLVPEDRCHLNGVAVKDGQAKYVTALGTTDTAGAWRANKASGGVLIDIQTDEVVLGGLSMPHSPRWYGGRLWVLNSGTGELLTVDAATGRAEVICGLPAYLRGLCFVGPFAVVGMCKIREKHIFGGLPIQQRYEKLTCGVSVIDLRNGAEVGRFEFTGGCEELYDVQFLPGILRPMILNLEKEAVHQAMITPDSSFWLRPSSQISDFKSHISDPQPGVPGVGAEKGADPLNPGGQPPFRASFESTGNMLPESGTQL